MKKLVSLVVLLALVAAACGDGAGSGDVAATVNGDDITVGDVEELIDSGGEDVTTDQFGQYLAVRIQWNILFGAAEVDYGVTATDDEVDAEATQLVEELANADESREDFLAARGVTEEFLVNIARQGVLDEKIRTQLLEDAAEPSQEEIDLARAEAEAALTNACVSHILVPTEDEATDAMNRLDEGEEFGELATELSTDVGSAENNGILPCGAPNQYVPPFREAVLDATVGEVYPEPVESQFGFHIILVTDRTDPAEADLPTDEDVAESAKEGGVLTELDAWFAGAMEDAEVTVAEEYGTWQANPAGITPPSTGSTAPTGTTEPTGTTQGG